MATIEINDELYKEAKSLFSMNDSLEEALETFLYQLLLQSTEGLKFLNSAKKVVERNKKFGWKVKDFANYNFFVTELEEELKVDPAKARRTFERNIPLTELLRLPYYRDMSNLTRYRLSCKIRRGGDMVVELPFPEEKKREVEKLVERMI